MRFKEALKENEERKHTRESGEIAKRKKDGKRNGGQIKRGGSYHIRGLKID